MPGARHRQPTSRNRRRGRRVAVDPMKLGRLLTRRKAGGLIITLLIILVIALLDRWGALLPVDDDWHRYHLQSFEVQRVIDGDTLDLDIRDGDKAYTRVRLWGVNTPEMGRRGSEAPPEPFAQKATDFTRLAAEGQRVILHLQDHRLRGRYGRLLAYVELPDGRILNAALISEGLSKHDDRWGHDQAERYDQLERRARADRRGLWGQ